MADDRQVKRIPFRAVRWYWEIQLPDGTTHAGFSFTRRGAERAVALALLEARADIGR